MKRKLIISTLALTAVLGTGMAASAHDRGDGPGMRGDRMGALMQDRLAEFDANKDGKITKEEIAAGMKAKFDAADTDGNGTLSPEELAAQADARMAERQAMRQQQMLERMDDNKDGALSFEEMQVTRADQMFDRLDADNDGALSAEELDDAGKMMGERGERGGHDRLHRSMRNH